MRRIAALAAAALSAALAAAPAAAGAPSVLAKLPGGADAHDVARDAGLTLARAFPEIGWAEFAVPDGDVAEAREDLLGDRRVFRLDWQRRGDGFEPQIVPSDTFTATPGSIGGASTDYQWRLPNFITAWDVGRGSAATRIAVLDSEIDVAHSELAPKVAGAYNAERQFPATYGTPDVRASDAQIAEANASPNDNDLHGSHVAGLAGAATHNGDGVSGAGFDSALLPVKVTLTVPNTPQGDATYVGNVVDGILWATGAGARVMNMSFGTGTYHQAIADAVAYAAASDVLPVAAAGNSQATAPGVPLYPGALPGVLAVAAVDPSGTITSFSTNGDYVDVAAPGVQILSTWDTRAPGQPLSQPPGARLAGYFALSGTSMATPIVSGLAALMRDLRPDLTAPQTEGLIQATAVDRGAPGRDVQYGFGLIDADAAMRAAAAFAAPPQPPPPSPAAAPIRQAPLRTVTRLRYRCRAGVRRVPAGSRLAVRRGARLVCRGSTLPALRRARLQVQRLVKGRWVRVATAPTTAEGRFGFTVRLRATGLWTIRAAVTATPSRAASAGPRASLTVLRRR
jgi:subtilisin family serine protease